MPDKDYKIDKNGDDKNRHSVIGIILEGIERKIYGKLYNKIKCRNRRLRLNVRKSID